MDSCRNFRTGLPFVAFGGLVCLVLAFWWNHAGVPDPRSQETASIRLMGTVRDGELREISGLAASCRYPDCFWVHNDSGDSSRIRLVSDEGETLAVGSFGGAENRDWEDCACFQWQQRSWILVGDVGDNGRSRDRCCLYLVPEPDLQPRPGQVAEFHSDCIAIPFRYSGGPNNCEAVSVDCTAGQVLLVEKLELAGGAGRTAAVHSLDIRAWLEGWLPAGNEVQILERIGGVPLAAVTGMDISPDGRQMVVRNYFQALHAVRESGQAWGESLESAGWVPLVLPVEAQGEAIAIGRNGRELFTTSEFAHQPIWRVALPDRESKK